MRALFTISAVILAVAGTFKQVDGGATAPVQLKWLEVDQLCGQLQLTKPIIKTIIVNGKREERSYDTYLSDADVLLYPGAESDRGCCGVGKPLARTRSNRLGSFALPGLEHGRYWLQIQKGELKREMPLLVTEDFNARKCSAPEVGRSFVVDSKPPSVQVRIR